MARTIAQRRIGGRALASRKIATTQPAGFDPYVTTFPPGSWTFNAPASGRYKFVAWGAGVKGYGNSGAYFEKTTFLTLGQAVLIVVGLDESNTYIDTTVTLPNGIVCTAQRGIQTSGTAAVATNGDVNLAGSLGGDGAGSPGQNGNGTGGGAGSADQYANGTWAPAGAPGMLPFRGGDAASLTNVGARKYSGPGAGGSSAGSSIWTPAGIGLVIAVRVG